MPRVSYGNEALREQIQQQQQTQAQQTGARTLAPVQTHMDAGTTKAAANAYAGRDSSAGKSLAWDRYVRMAREMYANPNPYADDVSGRRSSLPEAPQLPSGWEGSAGWQAQKDSYMQAALEYFSPYTQKVPEGWEGSAGKAAIKDRIMTDPTNPDNYETGGIGWTVNTQDRLFESMNRNAMQQGLVISPAQIVETDAGMIPLQQKVYYTGEDEALKAYAERLNSLGLLPDDWSITDWQEDSRGKLDELRGKPREIRKLQDEVDRLTKVRDNTEAYRQQYGTTAWSEEDERQYQTTLDQLAEAEAKLADAQEEMQGYEDTVQGAKQDYEYAMSFGDEETRKLQEEYGKWLQEKNDRKSGALTALEQMREDIYGMYGEEYNDARGDANRENRIMERYTDEKEWIDRQLGNVRDNYFENVYEQTAKARDEAEERYLSLADEVDRLTQIAEAREQLKEEQGTMWTADEEREYQETLRKLDEQTAARDEALRELTQAQQEAAFGEQARFLDIQGRADFEKLATEGAYAREHGDEWKLREYEQLGEEIEKKTEELREAVYSPDRNTEGIQTEITELKKRQEEMKKELKKEGILDRNIFDKAWEHLWGQDRKQLYEEDAVGITEAWTEGELKTYDALTAAGMEDRAREYAISVNTRHKAEAAGEKTEGYYELGYDENGSGWSRAGKAVLGTVGSVLTAPAALAQWYDQLLQASYTGSYTGRDFLFPNEAANAFSSGVSQGLNDRLGTVPESVPVIGGKGVGDVYQTINSSAQSLALGLTLGEAGTLVVFAGMSGAGAFDEAMQRGGDEGQAVLYSALRAAGSVLTEKVGLENLLAGDFSAQAMKSILVQAGIEGSEEFSEDLLGRFADRLAMGGKSELTQRETELVRKGVRPAEAREQARNEFLSDAAWDTISGAVSGGISAGTQAATEYVKGKIQQRQTEKQVNVFNNDMNTLADAEEEAEAAQKIIDSAGEHSEEEVKAAADKVKTAEEKAKEVYEKYGAERPESGSVPAAEYNAEFIMQNAESEESEAAGASQGSTGKIRSWAYDQSGELVAKVETDKGEERAVKAGDMTTDRGTAYLMQRAEMHPEYGDVLLNRYTEGQNPALYAQSFEAVADVYGRASTKSLEEAWALEKKNGGGLTTVLTREQFEAAFNAGRNEKNNAQSTMNNAQSSPAGRTSSTEPLSHSVTAPLRGEPRAESGTQRREGTVRFADVEADGRRYRAATAEQADERTMYAAEKLARLTGVSFVFYQSTADSTGRYKGANGFYRDGTVYLDVNAGADTTNEQSAILLTAAHEMTHHIRANNESGYDALRDFVIDHLLEEGEDVYKLARRKIGNSANPAAMTMNDAIEEVIADACEEMLGNTRYAEMMAKENPSLYESVRSWITEFAEKIRAAVAPDARRHREAVVMRKYADELQEMWDRALVGASANAEGRMQNAESESGTKASVREIIDEDGNSYGLGVYLDSTLLEKLTDDERKQMVKERVAELGGNSFTAIDPDGNEVLINIAEPNRTFKNSSGKRKNVNQDLIKKLNNNKLKQETVVLADELIETARYKDSREARYSHGWLDNYGKNDWEAWTVYVQDKNNTVWNAMLHIANSEDGKKYLYDIGPIRMAESPGRSGASTANNIKSQPSGNVKQKNSNRDITRDDTAEERAGREKSYAQLRAETERLKKRIDYWKGQSRITREASIYDKDIEKLTRSLLKEFDSGASAESIRQKLTDLGNYLIRGERIATTSVRTGLAMTESGTEDGGTVKTVPYGEQENGTQSGTWGPSTKAEVEINFEEVWETCQEIATEILDDIDIVVDDTNHDAREQLVSYLKAHPMDVSGLLKNEETNREWLREHREIKTRNGGYSVDAVYQELQGMFGVRTFPTDVPDGDQLDRIAAVLDAWEDVRGNPFELYMGEAVTDLANRIMDTMLSDEVRQTPPTRADRIQQRADERYNRLKERSEERARRKEEIYRQGTARLQERITKEKAAKWQKVAEVRSYYTDLLSKIADERRQSVTEAKETAAISKKAKRLRDMLTANTDKAHISEGLKKTVGQVLNAIDLSSYSYTEFGMETKGDVSLFAAMTAMNEMLSRQEKYMAGEDVDGEDMWLDISDEVKTDVENIIRRAREIEAKGQRFTVSRMNAEELRGVNRMLDNLAKAVRDYDRELGAGQRRRISELAFSTMRALNRLGTDKERTKAGEKARNFLFWENTTPVYAFDRLGEGGQHIFKGLRNGWDRLAFNAKEIIEFTEKTYSAKEARAWQKEMHSFTLENGEKMQITTAQLMSLHCLYKREQARKHLDAGGMRVNDIDVSGKMIKQVEHYKLSMQDVAGLLGMLTERQTKVADSLQEFMSGRCSDWGNEVSMERYGYRAFTEDNYFPIRTDSNDRAAVDPDRKRNDMFRLLNISATKAVNPKASNALVVDDIFRVFSDHSADMAKYNAMALPIVNMLKWYNFKESFREEDGEGNTRVYTSTTQKSLERAYGKAAQRYMVQFIKDLNGAHEGGTSTADSLTKRIISGYKAASVGFNMRVAIQQPTAYVRAAMVLEPKYLVKGLKPTKGSIEEMLQYSGIAAWKDLGYVQTDIGRGIRDQIMHTETAADKVKEKSMGLAEWGDKMTWGALWQASKAKAQDTLQSGEKLMEKTAEIFEEMVYHTQVVDATITRSQNMRNPGILQSMTTAYMAEPTLSFNLVLDAVTKYTEAKRAGESLREPAFRVAKSMAVYAAATAATLLAASLWDAFRDDDDYESFRQKFSEALWGDKNDRWYQSNAMNELLLFNKIPVVKDIWSIALGDTVDRMDMQAFQSMKKAIEIDLDALKIILGKSPTDSEFGDMTVYGKLMNNLKALSQVSGIAFYNLTRDVAALYNTTIGGIVGEKLTTYKPSDRRSIREAYQAGFLTEEEAMQELKERGVADSDNGAFWIVEEWRDGTTQESRMQEIYAAVQERNEGEYKRLMEELDTHGVTKSTIQSDIRGKIKEWYLGTEKKKASVSKQEAVELVHKYGGQTDRDTAVTVEKWTCRKVTGIDYSDIGESYINGDITLAEAEEMQLTYGYGPKSGRTADEQKDAEEDTRLKSGGWRMQRETGVKPGDNFNGIRDEYNAGRIDEATVIEWRMKYAGDDREQAENTAYRYRWIEGVPELKAVTGNQARLYDAYLKESGISKTDYYNAIDGHGADTFGADKVEGYTNKYVPNSKRDKVWAYIDSLKLSRAQKDAMAMLYADMNGNPPTKSWLVLEDAPWNNQF